MNFQIDVKPRKEDNSFHSATIWLNGYAYLVFIPVMEVERLVERGIISQTFGQRHNEKDELVRFEYPEGHDSAGVKYTSKVYEVKPLKVDGTT